MTLIGVAILITCICLIGSACFSGFENGMISIRRARLNHQLAEGGRSVRLIKHFLDRPATMLGTILLGNNLCNCLAAIYFDELVNSLHKAVWSSLAGSMLLTVFVLAFCEITPKVWFRQQPLERCRLLIYPIGLFHLLVWPFVRVLTLIVRLLGQMVGGSEGEQSRESEREDFRHMLLESEEASLIDGETRRLLERGLDFHQKQVREIMTPLDKVQVLSPDRSLAEALEQSFEHNVSRLPVAGNEGEWIGVFSAWDALFSIKRERWDSVAVIDCMRPLTSIYAEASINQVLPRSRITKSPLLAVIDAEKRPQGIVTTSDVLQPLFGDLRL